MKLDGRPFEGGKLGTGTAITVEGTRIILDSGSDDIILVTQEKDSLEVTINIQMTVTLEGEEAGNLEIRGHVIADESVSLPIPGLRSPVNEYASPSSRSAGFAFREKFKKWVLQQLVGRTREGT